jgi:CubicO group peptidase (beta-lactamase class C family)
MSIKSQLKAAAAIMIFTFGISTYSAVAQTEKSSPLENEEEFVTRKLKEHHIPYLGLGIIKKGKLEQIKSYGEHQLGKPAPYNTLINVASLTKPVVAMLTLKLVATGSWDLDAPLYPYWVDPDVANDTRSKILTTRHILTHQTGFVNWRRMHPTKKLTFDRDPGTKFGYSGEGFDYLKRALESKFKKKLEVLADSLIFRPLNMKESYFIFDKNIDQSRMAHWHDTLGNETYEAKMWSVAHAADDLVTTVEDYGKFMVATMEGFGLPKPLFEDMITPHARTSPTASMGLGWQITPNFRKKEPVISHEGADKGIHTIVCWLPESKDGLIIFTNGDNGWKVFRDLVERTFKEPVPR